MNSEQEIGELSRFIRVKRSGLEHHNYAVLASRGVVVRGYVHDTLNPPMSNKVAFRVVQVVRGKLSACGGNLAGVYISLERNDVFVDVAGAERELFKRLLAEGGSK